MVGQLQTWYVITTKEKLATKACLLEPWSDTPNAHITTFTHQLDGHQLECEDHGFTFAKSNKMDQFVAKMHACNLFKAKFVDDWE